MKKIPRSFYARPAPSVAKDLIGKTFVRVVRGRTLAGIIVEAEAYREDDPASHAYRGKTLRNAVMFGEPGHLYVYFTYGMHYCANVVTGSSGHGEAVLIRAVEPVEGISSMKKNRRNSRRSNDMFSLTNGPAKVCQAFQISKKVNGEDLLGGKIFLTDGIDVPSNAIGRSARIGITKGIGKRWRYYLKGNRWVLRSAAASV